MNVTYAIILFVAAASLISQAAAAAMPVEEILVTAKRRDTRLSEVSAAVAIVGQQDIRNQKLITDALQASPGVFLQQTTPGQGAAVVRGLKGSAVLHLVDGMRLNNAIFRSAPTQYLALVPTAAVERIEIVRGTQTSLYGTDAIGGVVKVRSRIPEFSDSTSSLRGEGLIGFDSAETTRKMQLLIEAGNDRHAVFASAEYQESGDRRTGGGTTVKPSAYSAKGARFAYSATPTADTSWLLDLQYYEQPDTPRVDELVPGFGQQQPSSSEFRFAPNQRSFVHLQRSNEAGIFGFQWVADLAWQRITDDRVTRDYEAPNRIRESNSSDLLGATLTASGSRGSIEWLAGADIYLDEVQSARSSTDINTAATTIVVPRYPDGSKMQQAGLFGRIDYRAKPEHLFSLGLRYSNVTIDIDAAPTNQAAQIDARDISGDLGWVFDTTASMQLFANLGFGFRAPNVFDIGSLGSRPGNRFNIPNTELESEHVVQADFGLRHNNERWSSSVSLYALRLEDQITSVFTGDVTPTGREVIQSVNGGVAEIYGAEIELQFVWSERLSARFVANYARGEQRLPGAATEPADRIPPLNGLVALTYSASDRLAVESWLRFADAQTRLSERDVRDVRINPNGTSGWGSAGISATWQSRSGLEVLLAIDNVLDKRFRQHGSGLDAVGRNFSLQLQKSWN